MERRRKRKNNKGITYRQGHFDPQVDAQIFNNMMGSNGFSSDGGGISEEYEEEAIKVAFETFGGDKAYGFIKKSDLRNIIDGKVDRVWNHWNPEDINSKYGNGTIKREDIIKVFGNSKEAKIANEYIRKMTPKKECVTMREDFDTTPYVLIDVKQVRDYDGFLTDYAWYYDEDEDVHFFMFGDIDTTEPDRAYADWECESASGARDWFLNYEGFEDDEDNIY